MSHLKLIAGNRKHITHNKHLTRMLKPSEECG